VVNKAVRSVYEDGMSFRAVSRRFARDFWEKRSEAMIRGWRGRYARSPTFSG
jgi:transposase